MHFSIKRLCHNQTNRHKRNRKQRKFPVYDKHQRTCANHRKEVRKQVTESVFHKFANGRGIARHPVHQFARSLLVNKRHRKLLNFIKNAATQIHTDFCSELDAKHVFINCHRNVKQREQQHGYYKNDHLVHFVGRWIS